MLKYTKLVKAFMASINVSGTEFSLAEATSTLEPLLILVAGMIVYSVFIFKFYRALARRDIFKLDLNKYNESKHPFFYGFFAAIFYVLEYLIIFPLFVFFWFLVIVVLISLISTRSFDQILLASMALIATTRICAYYNEDLSKDIAKMIPFALLGIFIIDVKLITLFDVGIIIEQFLSLWKNAAYYFILIVCGELILRCFSGFIHLFRK